MTDPENRFHALKFALATPGITASNVMLKATEYLSFLEGSIYIGDLAEDAELAQYASVMEAMKTDAEDTELADNTES